LLNNTKSINYIDVNKKHKIFFVQKKDHNHQGHLMMFSNTYTFTITNYYLSVFFYFI